MAGVEAVLAKGCIVASSVRQNWCEEFLGTEEVVMTMLCSVVWTHRRCMLVFDQTVIHAVMHQAAPLSRKPRAAAALQSLALVSNFSCISHFIVCLVVLFLTLV